MSFADATPKQDDSVQVLLRKLLQTIQEQSGGLQYIPGNPSDWAGTAPDTVKEAIDRLAAASPGA